GRGAKVVSIGSLTPTMLDLVHAKYETYGLPYLSLIDFVVGRPANAAPPVFSVTTSPYEPKIAVMFDGLKYIESRDTGRQELFDRAKDPQEQMSTAPLSPDTVARWLALFAE